MWAKPRPSPIFTGMTDTATIDPAAMRRHRLTNTLHTGLLAGGSLLLLAVTAWVFGGPIGVVLAIVFGAVSLAAVRRVSPQMVLSMYKARPVTEAEFPAGVRLLRILSQRAGLPAAPKLHVIPSQMMNAFAVGRRDDSVIAITDALARRLTMRELAGVLAHEISHIAHEDIKVMALADIVSRFTSVMSTVGLLTLIINIGGLFGGMGEPVPWLAVLVLLAAPTVGGLLQMALSRTREFDADFGAAVLTGDPDGLASALQKLERARGRLWEGILLPGGRIPDPSVLRTHPATKDRLERLAALKAEMGALAGEAAIVLPSTSTPARPIPVPRGSLVPRIHQHGGRHGPLYGSLMAPLAEIGDAPGCDASLHMPDGAPRVRLLRGLAWW
ncbi:zinc metalloprotease HtpX [Mesorhizobium sp. LHD-90]|uniref:zinc metalloprotease HtpX n=1 Tax=Mesorhizobium sp. LHD-90 TaxID=3071414 RepID=UPI0027DFC4A7|nr:zinc metalloprotease HtpX [Mesorhizobium sp. LHD-90]MDQ6434230.1 zinc metalloprotease HtpX [Mesorhizobium sp. LHD-90]